MQVQSRPSRVEASRNEVLAGQKRTGRVRVLGLGLLSDPRGRGRRREDRHTNTEKPRANGSTAAHDRRLRNAEQHRTSRSARSRAPRRAARAHLRDRARPSRSRNTKSSTRARACAGARHSSKQRAAGEGGSATPGSGSRAQSLRGGESPFSRDACTRASPSPRLDRRAPRRSRVPRHDPLRSDFRRCIFRSTWVALSRPRSRCRRHRWRPQAATSSWFLGRWRGVRLTRREGFFNWIGGRRSLALAWVPRAPARSGRRSLPPLAVSLFR